MGVWISCGGYNVERPDNYNCNKHPKYYLGPTLVGSGLILLNTAFGASLLTLPYIVKTSGGVVPFVVIQYSVATLAMISMFVLGQ